MPGARSTAPRFFVATDLAVGASIELPEAAAHHAQHALRLRDGEPIVLFNGRGGEYAALLRAGRRAHADIVAFDAVEREAPFPTTLVQALASSDRTDRVVEKAVELGAASVLLAPAARSVLRLDGGTARTERKLAHWREIAVAACCQCGRNRIPRVDLAASLDDAFATAPAGDRYVLLPDAPSNLVAALAARTDARRGVVIAVGPEGGFTDNEIAAARARGFAPARLGPRVLRTETAGIAALAALQATVGDFAAAPGGGDQS